MIIDKSMDSEYIISLDLGGTKLLGILINRSAGIIARQQLPSPKGNEAVRDSIIDLLSNILVAAGELKIQPSGIAICAPGFVDSRDGIMIEAENLQVENLSLTQPVEKQFHLPARLFHDVRSATLGEALFGAGLGRRDFIFLNIGTGVAVGLYLDGKVYHGAEDKAGEIGHLALKPVGPGKPCGLEERLEMLVSGPALVRRALAQLAHTPDSLIFELAGHDPERVTTQIIQEAALRQDPLAIQLCEETADFLGLAIGGLQDLLNPECIILGGGLTQMGDLLLNPIQRSVARYAIESVPILLSTLGRGCRCSGRSCCLFLPGRINMLHAGIIGAGYIGEYHARGYAGLPDVRLAAVVDPNLTKAQKLAEQYQAEALPDLEALIASNVDLVSICTPTPSHMQIANDLMRAGKHVLCEKPIARTLEHAQSMIDTAHRTGVKFMIAHVSRYEVDHRKAKEILERGEIGDLRMAFHAITSTYPAWSVQDWLGDEEKSGGPIVDLAIHSVDYMLWLFKSPVERVYALGSQKTAARNHYVLASLQFANGGLGLVETSWAHPPSAPLSCRVELCGTSGRIAWDYDHIDGMQTLIEGQGRRSYVLEGENSFAAEIASFVQSIENDLPPPVPGDEGKEALRVCLAALKSLKSGRCVELDR